MDKVLALSPHAGTRLAEVAFLLLLFTGLLLMASRFAPMRGGMVTVRTVVAGLALAAAGVLLIIATHWGSYGHR